MAKDIFCFSKKLAKDQHLYVACIVHQLVQFFYWSVSRDLHYFDKEKDEFGVKFNFYTLSVLLSFIPKNEIGKIIYQLESHEWIYFERDEEKEILFLNQEILSIYYPDLFDDLWNIFDKSVEEEVRPKEKKQDDEAQVYASTILEFPKSTKGKVK